MYGGSGRAGGSDGTGVGSAHYSATTGPTTAAGHYGASSSHYSAPYSGTTAGGTGYTGTAGGGSYGYGYRSGGAYDTSRGGGGMFGGGYVVPRQAPEVAVPPTEKEILLQTFSKWDLKGNGHISEKELCQVLIQLGIDKRKAALIFDQMDLNYDRKVDYKEFVYWLYGKEADPIIKEKALTPSYKCLVEKLWVDLKDPRIAPTAKPFVRWHDHFTNQIICESPEGASPSCQVDVSSAKAPLIFDIPGDSIKAVIVDVCEKRKMRSPKVLAHTQLPLASVVKAIASGLKGPYTVEVPLYVEAVGGGGKSQEMGSLRVSISEAGSDTIWSVSKVAQWKKDGLPAIMSLLEVNQVLETLVLTPDPRLEMSASKRAEALALAAVDGFLTWSPQQAAVELDSVAHDLLKLKATARKSAADTYDSTYRTLSEGRERVAVKVLRACNQITPPDYHKMKVALKFAQDVDPQNRDLPEVEHAFKELLKLPDHAKVDDLMRASDEDLVQLQPSDFGLTLAADGDAKGKVSDDKRFSARDQTAERVLAILGCHEKPHYASGTTYEQLAMETIALETFQPSQLVAELMKRVIVFRGEKEPHLMPLAARVARQKRDWQALVGRFDVAAVPVYAEYDSEFHALDGRRLPQGFFGREPMMPVGGPGWFWTLHAAAINIGETERAEDFDEYSIRPEPIGVGYRGRHGASKILDESKYVADMTSLWRRALECAARIGIEDMVVFPFGMGAFLRNLHLLDSSYSEVAPMRRLRKRVAQGFFEAVAGVCLRCQPMMRVHLCLFDGSLEARMNHNVFVEAAAAAARDTAAIALVLRFHRNTDAMDLARHLASTPDAATNQPRSGESPPCDVRKVGLLNGANNKLLGNHWFANGARTAIDENLHRRSGAMCLASLMLNMATAPQERSMQELVKNAKVCGSQVVDLLPYPTALGTCRHMGRFFAHVSVRPYGVLGVQQAKDRSRRLMAPAPDPSVVIVDPTDMQHVLRGPTGVVGISDEIYGWLGLRTAPAFPDEVRAAIKDRLQAKAHDYGGKVVVHVVGPNLREGRRCTRAEAVRELGEAYGNILAQFVSTSAKVLRLIPLCSLSGPFAEQLPAMTADALQAGFTSLGPKTQDKVLDTDHIEMCVYAEQDLQLYAEAFREPPFT